MNYYIAVYFSLYFESIPFVYISYSKINKNHRRGHVEQEYDNICGSCSIFAERLPRDQLCSKGYIGIA